MQYIGVTAPGSVGTPGGDCIPALPEEVDASPSVVAMVTGSCVTVCVGCDDEHAATVVANTKITARVSALEGALGTSSGLSGSALVQKGQLPLPRRT